MYLFCGVAHGTEATGGRGNVLTPAFNNKSKYVQKTANNRRILRSGN
jgi:hypothetical protein